MPCTDGLPAHSTAGITIPVKTLSAGNGLKVKPVVRQQVEVSDLQELTAQPHLGPCKQSLYMCRQPGLSEEFWPPCCAEAVLSVAVDAARRCTWLNDASERAAFAAATVQVCDLEGGWWPCRSGMRCS